MAMRVALIGCGAIGTALLELVKDDAGLDIAAIVVPADFGDAASEVARAWLLPPAWCRPFPGRASTWWSNARATRHRAARAAGAAARRARHRGLGRRAVRPGLPSSWKPPRAQATRRCSCCPAPSAPSTRWRRRASAAGRRALHRPQAAARLDRHAAEQRSTSMR
jgi:hypothetical protein